MPALFVFLLKVNIALLLFCAGYYLVLRHLTFYTLNRVYLVLAILFATVYPKINLSGFVQQHQQIAKPVRAIVINWQAPAEKFADPLSQPNYWYWVEVIFWVGAALLALRLLGQLYSLYKLYSNSTSAQIHDHKVRVINGNAGPFSFWKSIYVNPARHEPADLKAILMHEQVHINDWHTLDILLAEISAVFYWFNPGIWLMKRAIRENIEFITDQKIIRNGADSKQYQYSLVSVSFASSSNTLVNHFNISTIKKRIIMMNAKRSSNFTLTRYAFLVPAVIALLLVFSISKAALIKKSSNTHLDFSIKTKLSGTKADNNLVPIIENKRTAASAGLHGKSVTNNSTDTIRKGSIFLSSSIHSDSVSYVINGVKATSTDFKALDSKRIYSIELIPAEQARKIVDVSNNKNNVLFVTTDDSDAGKKFKQKIDKLFGMDHTHYSIAAISKDKSNNGTGSISISPDDSSATTYSYSSSPAVANGYSVATGDNDGRATVKLYTARPRKRVKGKRTADTLNVNGEAVIVQTDEPDSSKGSSFSSGRSYTNFKTVTIKPKIAVKTSSWNNHAYTLKSNLSFNTNMNNEINIEHLSTKLIIIDGKEATEHDLKKLSAADIESMSAKTGDDMVEKYGDKAKNGVLFISTKKK